MHFSRICYRLTVGYKLGRQKQNTRDFYLEIGYCCRRECRKRTPYFFGVLPLSNNLLAQVYYHLSLSFALISIHQIGSDRSIEIIFYFRDFHCDRTLESIHIFPQMQIERTFSATWTKISISKLHSHDWNERNVECDTTFFFYICSSVCVRFFFIVPLLSVMFWKWLYTLALKFTIFDSQIVPLVYMERETRHNFNNNKNNEPHFVNRSAWIDYIACVMSCLSFSVLH